MTDDLQVGTVLPVVETGGSPVDPTAAPGPAETRPAETRLADTRTAHTASGDDPMDWSWPPYAPLEPAGGRRFDCEDWAPSSIVRRPRLRVGRWTLLYRRGS